MAASVARIRVAILISGTGSNMAALIDASRALDAAFEVALVISNKPEAHGLVVARGKGVEAICIDHRPFGKDRQAHERAIDTLLTDHAVEVVVLAGYMRVLTPWLVGRWAGRMLNIHPSLLPRYPGLDTHARAISAGDAEGGCTVHIVTDGVDEGPMLGQARVSILPGDSPDALAERVHVAEHGLYRQVLQAFCRDRQSERD
ncbi:phosphoribosylglycinamide formyltransferase [soil metagenome]